jgi:hypothetical protein
MTGFGKKAKFVASRLDADRLAAAKSEAVTRGEAANVSTNDLLTSGFFIACGSKIGMMGIDCRGRLEASTRLGWKLRDGSRDGRGNNARRRLLMFLHHDSDTCVRAQTLFYTCFSITTPREGERKRDRYSLKGSRW